MKDAKVKCQHRWPSILMALGVPEKLLNGRHQPCFDCGGKDRFRFTDHAGTGAWVCNQCAPPGSSDGFTLVERYFSVDFPGAIELIEEVIGEAEVRPAQGSNVDKARKRLRRIWADSKPLSKRCPTHLYLLNRGLAGLDFGSLKNLRCHPGITFWDEIDGRPVDAGKHPAMIGLVTTPEGEPATVHITYLNPNGNKASFKKVRKLMPTVTTWTGGAIRLQTLSDEQVLCVAEGIETALSMKLHYPDCCPWAVISANNMEKFEPPNDSSAAIHIAADNDLNFTGHAAAYALAKRMCLSPNKREVQVFVPESAGTDFNDNLRGAAA